MTTYAAQQDLIDRFGQQELIEISDHTNTGSIDATVVSRALNDTDALINTYLSTRYTLPLSSTPTELVRIACDIARYYLYDDGVTEQVRTRYQDAIVTLKGVAAGTMSLGVDGSNVVPPASGGVKSSANDRVFTQRTLCDY